jgi:hypothetical protein
MALESAGAGRAASQSGISIKAKPSGFLGGHWRFAGPCLTAFLFKVWFGMTGNHCEEIIGLSSLGHVGMIRE